MKMPPTFTHAQSFHHLEFLKSDESLACSDRINVQWVSGENPTDWLLLLLVTAEPRVVSQPTDEQTVGKALWFQGSAPSGHHKSLHTHTHPLHMAVCVTESMSKSVCLLLMLLLRSSQGFGLALWIFHEKHPIHIPGSIVSSVVPPHTLQRFFRGKQKNIRLQQVLICARNVEMVCIAKFSLHWFGFKIFGLWSYHSNEEIRFKNICRPVWLQNCFEFQITFWILFASPMKDLK